MNGRPFIPAWLDDGDLTPNQFRVMCHLWRRADDSQLCWPSVPSIATVCKIHRDTVWAVLRVLEEKGLIARFEMRGRSNRYRILIPSGNEGPGGNGGGNEGPAETKGRPPAESDGLHPAETKGREGNPRKEPQRRSREIPAAMSFPENLSTPAFRETWIDWTQHRKEIRKPLTPASIRKQLNTLAAMGEPRAIAAINHSIANGWQGIFEPKRSVSADPQPKRAADLRL